TSKAAIPMILKYGRFRSPVSEEVNLSLSLFCCLKSKKAAVSFSRRFIPTRPWTKFARRPARRSRSRLRNNFCSLARTDENKQRSDNPARDHHRETGVERSCALTQVAENFWADKSA